MTISSNLRKAGPYAGNAATTAFPFAYKVFTASDVVVTKSDSVTETTLVLTTDYTVALNADQNANPGGAVTYPASGSPLPVGQTLTLSSSVPELQPTSITNQGGFYPKIIEDALDRLTIFVQQIKEQLNRSLRLPISVTGVSTQLPIPIGSQVIAWKPDGSGLQNVGPVDNTLLAVQLADNADLTKGATLIGYLGGTLRTYLNQFITSAGASIIGWIQSGAGAVTRLVQDKLRETVSVKDFGAKGDGVTDDSAAIQAALNSGNVVITAPAASYRCAAGITIPAGVSFIADGFMPSNPPRGAKLIFDLAVPTCVTMGGTGANNVSCSFKGFNVLRAAGAIPAGSIGVLNKYTYASIIEDVNIVRHAICLLLLSDGGSLGITCNMNRVFTAGATDSHVVVDTLPEARFNQCRFGMNGGGDFNCNSYIRIQGGSLTNPANGPNSIVFQNCQFNQGSNAAAAWINFANITPGTVSDLGLVQVDNCYIETSTIGITSDATWTSINRFQMSNCTYNMNSAREFVALDAATSIDNWTISGNIFNAKFTVAPTPQINFMNVSNNIFLGATSITGAGNSVVTFGDNTYIGGLSILGHFAQGVFKGGSTPNGSFTHTATGGVLIDLSPYNLLTNWTPQLAIAGSSAGITTSVAQGTYQIIGNMVFCQISLALTSKGATAGVVTISNLPVPQLNTTVDSSGSGAIGYAVNMAGLPSLPVINVSGAGINLYVTSATGVTSLLDTNLTNTTVLRGTFNYVRAL